MICKNCGIEIDGSYGSGKFCSRGCSNTRKQTEEIKRKISSSLKKIPDKLCKLCNSVLDKKNKFGICQKCRILHKKSRSYIVSLQRKKRKQDLVNYKGGKCIVCGYNKCNSALDFHHLKKDEKNFTITDELNHSKKLEDMIKEVDKCILLCRNCHAEVHEGLINLRAVSSVG